jgi:hypothetical protein
LPDAVDQIRVKHKSGGVSLLGDGMARKEFVQWRRFRNAGTAGADGPHQLPELIGCRDRKAVSPTTHFLANEISQL